MKKKISIVNACYNEALNIPAMYETVRDIMAQFPQYDYEHLFADNCSTDNSAEILEELCKNDSRVKVILNQRNFGAERSGLNLRNQASGDCMICLASDFQDPPEMIPILIKKWEEGNKLVLCQRKKTKANPLMEGVRKLYYKIIKSLSDTDDIIDRCTGFGLYDREVMDWLRWINDADQPTRFLVTDLGFTPCLVPFEQQKRRAGKTSYNFFKYFDAALTSLISTSHKPIRIMTYFGFFCAFASFAVGVVYLVLKLINWDNFNAGIAPVAVGLFFLGSVQIICLGMIGEYVGVILNKVTKKPTVVERKRLNFDTDKNSDYDFRK